MLASGSRLVYYTTASTAIQIFRNREIWMRNAQVMNDFMEVEHGLRCVRAALGTESGRRLQSLANTFFPGVIKDVIGQFEAWAPGLRADTFLTCVSEHPETENAHGRLSMWRAYGADTGVALVLNPGVFLRPSYALAAYSMPVAYFEEDQMADQLAQVTDRMQSSPNFVGSLGPAGFREAMFQVLRYAAVCTKHPAFSEEREWRVVASPAIQSSPLLKSAIEVIGGIPQPVLKIPLKDEPEKGLYEISPDAFINKVLIGPCEHPQIIYRALFSTLEQAGITDPGPRIAITGIPLRPNQR